MAPIDSGRRLNGHTRRRLDGGRSSHQPSETGSHRFRMFCAVRRRASERPSTATGSSRDPRGARGLLQQCLSFIAALWNHPPFQLPAQPGGAGWEMRKSTMDCPGRRR